MTKLGSSASSIVVPSGIVIHLVNGVQFLNDTCVAGAAVNHLLLKCKHRCNHKN